MERKEFDILIVGGGVAGMSAAVYAKRRGKNVAIIEKMGLGGTVVTLNRIENFPSYAKVDGFTLSQNFAAQVKALEVPIIFDEILAAELAGTQKVLKGKKAEYIADGVIIATGLSNTTLGVNEEEFVGKGVSYCVECDANLFKGKDVCVASKNGSGLFAANKLAKICGKQVFVIDSGDLSVYAAANKNPQIEVVSGAEIIKLFGKDALSGVCVKVNGQTKQIITDALFIELGRYAKTEIFKGLKLDAKGFIETDQNMQTNLADVFAVGDVRAGVMKQIVTAANDGAIAGNLCCM